MSKFNGIPVEALDFYEDLAADNSKAFWTAHKAVYDTAVKEPMTALVAELEDEFGPAKIFRPYRDVRFSKDKTPYKTAQGAVVHVAPGAGYYVQIDASGLYLGSGFYSATTEQITRLRETIDDEVRGAELVRILDELRTAGFTVGGELLKTRPKGYPADHPRIDLLRHKTLVASLAVGAPAWLHTPAAATEIRTAWRTMGPFMEWLGQIIR